jgi:signal transduction histidine kinase
MFKGEAHHLIGLVLDLFAQTGKVPIAMYEYNEKGEVVETLRSDEGIFPKYCRMMWDLHSGNVRDVCIADMCERAKCVMEKREIGENICHAGLSNNTEPIIINNEVVAAIQYGAYIHEENKAENLKQYEICMQKLRVEKSSAERLRSELEVTTPKRTIRELETLRKTLSPILQKVIEVYVLQQAHNNDVQIAAMHEIQLKLQSILARAENLLDKFVENTDEYISIVDIIGATEACGTSIHSLTMGDYLPQKYIFKQYSIKGFIDRATSLCNAEARRKKVDILVELSPDDGKYYLGASESHLQQAFNNIIQNAVKYSYRTTEYSNKRYIKIMGKKENQGYEITVSNYGVGIEEDEYELVFKGGYKGRLTRAEYRTGSGRGLALSKQIINKHHGTIVAHSEPRGEKQDGGTKPYITYFKIWLPQRQPQEEV